MFVNSVIVEQVDYNGNLKSVQLSSNDVGRLTIAFPDEYDNKRSGPFHFQNQKHNKVLRKLYKSNGRKLEGKHFSVDGELFSCNIPWRGIPTKRGELSYYALSLPQYAVLVGVSVHAPQSKQLMKKAVIKDKQKDCYVIYIECRSKYGSFDFDVSCNFLKAGSREFYEHQYHDDYLIDDVYAHYDAWRMFATDEAQEQIGIFMEGNNVEIYNVQQAGAVGRNAQANNVNITQTNQSSEGVDPEQLIKGLAQLREEMMKLAKSPEQVMDVAKIAEVEIAVRNGDIANALSMLKSAGKWAFDTATKLGIAIAVKYLS